uniref:Uncharacterized protein n=1 Tax=Anguilla anguilla TaxID=7936 RepID=A0A0E9V6U5_ANGAN
MGNRKRMRNRIKHMKTGRLCGPGRLCRYHWWSSLEFEQMCRQKSHHALLIS